MPVQRRLYFDRASVPAGLVPCKYSVFDICFFSFRTFFMWPDDGFVAEYNRLTSLISSPARSMPGNTNSLSLAWTPETGLWLILFPSMPILPIFTGQWPITI
jgi:hypothetical protein